MTAGRIVCADTQAATLEAEPHKLRCGLQVCLVLEVADRQWLLAHRLGRRDRDTVARRC